MKVSYPRDVQRLYEREKEKYSNEPHILTIQECTPADIQLPSAARLAKYGLGDYTTVELDTNVVDLASGDDKDDNAAGRAVPVKGPRGHVTAIFLRDSYENCPDDLTFWVVRLGVLYHELGHAWDHKTGQHTDVERGTSNLQGAEEYADEFARVRMSRVECNLYVRGAVRRNLWEIYDLYRHRGNYQPE